MKKPLIRAACAVVIFAGLGYTVTQSHAVKHSTPMDHGQQAAPALSIFPLTAAVNETESTTEQVDSDNKQDQPFRVSQNGNHLNDFTSFTDAVLYAREYANSTIAYKTDSRMIWSNLEELPESASVAEVPLISQLPELERGCEVTSLAMILGFDGIEVDKMTLADEVKKDPSPFEVIDGQIHFGNPNTGFVGNMETFEESGLGVYHEPIEQLAVQYVGDRAVDLTGSDFEDVLRIVSSGRPVWVIDNLTYAPLSEDLFETWQTEDGPVDITYQEHSLVITGYTPDTILLNDPIVGKIEVERGSFAGAWVQMGSQAIVILNKEETDKESSI